MSSARFVTGRDTGQSDADVVVALVAGAEPGTLFSHEAMIQALSVGVTRSIDVTTVRHAVRSAYARLLRDHARTLQSVPGMGYRLAEAAAHQAIARSKQRRADVQLRRGVQVLQHVRWDEMDATSRAAHEGTLLIMSALYENQRAMERRQQKIEETLRRITG
jgi:hypothetical protein